MNRVINCRTSKDKNYASLTFTKLGSTVKKISKVFDGFKIIMKAINNLTIQLY